MGEGREYVIRLNKEKVGLARLGRLVVGKLHVTVTIPSAMRHSSEASYLSVIPQNKQKGLLPLP